MILGKGMWIWQVERCCGGDIAEIVAKAKRAGLSHILVKLADGAHTYGREKARDLCRALRQGGIQPVGWIYSRGKEPTAEAHVIAEAAAELLLTCFVIDAEGEYEAAGMATQATALVRSLRGIAPGLELGLSSYYLPDLHPQFPWPAFASVDIIIPQVYWYERDPDRALLLSLAQNGLLYPAKPIIPTGCVYPQAMGELEDLARFLAAVNEAALPAVNFWDWQHCTPEAWTMIRDFEVRTER